MKLGSLLLLALAPYLAAGFRPAYAPDECQNRVDYLVLSYAPEVKPAAEACYAEGDPNCLVALAGTHLCDGGGMGRCDLILEPMKYDCHEACVDEVGELCCDIEEGACAEYFQEPEEYR